MYHPITKAIQKKKESEKREQSNFSGATHIDTRKMNNVVIMRILSIQISRLHQVYCRSIEYLNKTIHKDDKICCPFIIAVAKN